MRRIALLYVCACLGMLHAVPGTAGSSTHPAPAALQFKFAIPAQALSSALIAFGRQAGMQVLMAGTIADRRTAAVNGQLTATEALDRLLRDSGLGYALIDAGTVVVRPLTPAPVDLIVGAPAPAKTDSLQTTRLAQVYAQGLIGPDIGYIADASDSATRTDSALGDVPESIHVVTRDLINSQQNRTVADAVRNLPGVQITETPDGVPSFYIRGFPSGKGMTDGMSNNYVGWNDFPPLIGVERVEVLKGPQSILGDYSTDNNFGGLVNVIMKKPQNEPVRRLSYAIGQYGDTQVGIDLAGPLSKHPSLAYRLVLSGEYANRTAQGYRGPRSGYVAPSIGWTGDASKLVVGWMHQLDRIPVPDHTILLGDTLASSTPPDLLPGNPQDHDTYLTNRFYYDFRQRLGGTWVFRSRGQYVRQTQNEQKWELNPLAPDGNVNASAETLHESDSYYTLQNDVIGTFGHGALEHRVVVGFDYTRSRYGSRDIADNDNGLPYNIYAPPLPTAASATGPSSHTPGSPWLTYTGLFLQDQIALGDDWNALLAVRRWSYEFSANDINSEFTRTLHRSQWVPNAGLVYKPNPDTSLYGSIVTGFQPDPWYKQNHRLLAPTHSRQIEIGAKFDLFEHRAHLTASLYRIMLDHSSDTPSQQPPLGVMHGPGQTNDGVEIEYAGYVAPGMEISANYTLTRIHNHDGTPPTGTPRQQFNLWASYWFRGGTLHGWGVASGIRLRSHTWQQNWNDDTYFNIPGQTEVDANVAYRTDSWSVTLGVRNLSGRRLYSGNFDNEFVPLYNRRTFMLTGAYDF